MEEERKIKTKPKPKPKKTRAKTKTKKKKKKQLAVETALMQDHHTKTLVIYKLTTHFTESAVTPE